MNPNDVLGELIEKGQNVTTNAVKSTVSDISDSVSGQIGVKNEVNVKAQTQSQSQPQDQIQQQGESSQVQTERTKEMVRDFYSPSDDLSYNAQTATATEEQQLASVRQKLHQEQHNEVYFNAILNADAPKQQEERPAEKMEREKIEDLQIEQKKKQNELPIAVQRAQTHEMTPGIAG